MRIDLSANNTYTYDIAYGNDDKREFVNALRVHINSIIVHTIPPEYSVNFYVFLKGETKFHLINVGERYTYSSGQNINSSTNLSEIFKHIKTMKDVDRVVIEYKYNGKPLTFDQQYPVKCVVEFDKEQ